ncbi:MAG: helix-turn-helix domain-containing protein [Saprospiraceae bacterium]|nr:helix-turn-helix domain-containing protein [Saprospiraceae bacterium]
MDIHVRKTVTSYAIFVPQEAKKWHQLKSTRTLIQQEIQPLEEQIKLLEHRLRQSGSDQSIDRWMSVQQVAKYLSVSRSTVYNWENEGRIKRHQFSSRVVRYDRLEIDQKLSMLLPYVKARA